MSTYTEMVAKLNADDETLMEWATYMDTDEAPADIRLLDLLAREQYQINLTEQRLKSMGIECPYRTIDDYLGDYPEGHPDHKVARKLENRIAESIRMIALQDAAALMPRGAALLSVVHVAAWYLAEGRK